MTALYALARGDISGFEGHHQGVMDISVNSPRLPCHLSTNNVGSRSRCTPGVLDKRETPFPKLFGLKELDGITIYNHCLSAAAEKHTVFQERWVVNIIILCASIQMLL
jgi:hypothetical protein